MKQKSQILVDTGDKIIPLHELPWWKKDKYGWPIETIKGHPFKAFIRVVCQNIRKISFSID